MTKIKKAVVLILAILIILVSIKSNIFAITIQQRPDDNNISNNSLNQPDNNVTNNNVNNNTNNNVNNNTSNNTNNNANNSTGSGLINNNSARPINTSNSTENLPYAGIGDKYFNFVLIILVALVLGIFSFVQYNKISKKENQD